MRAYPLVAIMLVALVGCGNAEKEKAEQEAKNKTEQKAALMQEYDFEKSVLNTLEKELADIISQKNEMQSKVDTVASVVRLSEMHGREPDKKLVQQVKELQMSMIVYLQAEASKQTEIKKQKSKIKNMESAIKEMKN